MSNELHRGQPLRDLVLRVSEGEIAPLDSTIRFSLSAIVIPVYISELPLFHPFALPCHFDYGIQGL
jgi:hypothetical protein